MITHYRNDVLKKLDKAELLQSVEISPIFVEKIEAELVDAKHITDVNGPDGIMPNGDHLEIKTQLYSGNYTLRGRGKFGSVSQSILNAKLKNNERIIVAGYDTDGQVYYRFNFDFTAIANSYANTIKTTETTKWSNYDTYPSHYVNHSSFSVKYVADQSVLDNNAYKFQPKFFDFLTHINNGKDASTFY